MGRDQTKQCFNFLNAVLPCNIRSITTCVLESPIQNVNYKSCVFANQSHSANHTYEILFL